MDPNSLILISVDDHVIEPPDMFEGRMPAKYQDRAPRVEPRPDGSDVWLFEDEVVANIGLVAVAGRPAEEYNFNPTAFTDMRRACWDIDERVRDMSANGVLASLCFPSFPQFCGQLFSRQKDKELSLATIKAYNDWHIDHWAGTHKGRIIPLGLLPLWDATLMAQEVHRLAAAGCHAVTFSENPYQLGLPSLHTDNWDPFWAACAEVDTVVCMHIGSSSKLAGTSPDAPVDVSMVMTPINLYGAATDMLWSGAFNRFPGLKIALSEGGIGWIPYFLERADYSFVRHHKWTFADFGGRLPSEVFKDHFITCFIDDVAGLRNRDLIGTDKMCWECDYPHSDSTWPQSAEQLSRSLAGLSRNEIDDITHRNAMKWFQFDPFAHVSREQATVGALRSSVGEIDLTFSTGKVNTGGAKGEIFANASG